MKKTVFISLCFLIPLLSFAQQQKIFQTMNTSGGALKSPTHYVTYSMGNAIIYKLQGNERIATQGFQQPKFNISYVTDVADVPEAALIKAYPNPVNDELTIEYDADKIKPLTLDITDIQGKIIYSTPLLANANQAKLSLHEYMSGSYFIIVKQSGRIIKTLKIIKSY